MRVNNPHPNPNPGTPGPGKAVPWPGVETLPYYSPLFPNLAPKPFASFHVRSSSGGIEHKLRELCASPLAEVRASRGASGGA